MIKHLFLDLENTIITPAMNGWHHTELINVEKIKNIISDFKPDHVHVFSFAIWNKIQLHEFNASTRSMIEKALGVKLENVPTVNDDIIPACCSIRKIHSDRVTFSDASEFWCKHESFRLFTRFTFKNAWPAWESQTHVMLLDDMVFNEKFEWADMRITGEIKNIDNQDKNIICTC